MVGGRRGFTLIELVVVMLILALVTHLAVREMSHLRDGRMRKTADRQLAELRDAVWCERKGDEPTGFIVDMGRLPQGVASTNEDARAVVSLRELWVLPDGVAPYALRQAAESNLVVSASEKAALADEDVWVACGWRGPYMHMPFSSDRLTDAWGNPFENKDDAGYDRLLDAGGKAVAVCEPVWTVRHFGADGRSDSDVTPADESRKDASVTFLPSGGDSNRLVVNASFVNASGPASYSGTVTCKWYAPCGGAITGAVEKVTLDSGSLCSFSFEHLPPGMATIAIWAGDAKRAQERIVISPGGRDLTLKVAIP